MSSLFYLARFHGWTMLRKLRLRQLPGLAAAAVEWKLGRAVCRSFPFVFRLEPAAMCNLRCPLCSLTWKEFEAGTTRTMTLDTFAAVLDQIAPHAAKLTFYMAAEPMMNRQLFDMVQLANERANAFTSFSTNFTLMRRELLPKLFASGLDWISISIDGYRQETYEKYRVRGRVQRVLDGIAMVCDHKRRHGLRRPYVMVCMIDFDHVPPSEVTELERFCEHHGVDEFNLRLDETGLLGPNPNPVPARRRPSECAFPWLSMSIGTDGSVYPCPIAVEQDISYGNLATEPIDEIWNNDLYVTTRRYLRTPGDDRSGLPKLPCFNCRWYGKTPATDPMDERERWLAEAGIAASQTRARREAAQVRVRARS
jgi:radical SAM protein with 4Fe4S-binding SPASM domain